jgi:hypothetical protein
MELYPYIGEKFSGKFSEVFGKGVYHDQTD